MLWLLETILTSNIVVYHGEDINVGLPIGYYTSQWFANFYLQNLDHFIKEKLHIRCYIRYIDDMVMFGCNKRDLHKCLTAIKKELKEIDLKLKDNYQIFRFDYIDKDGKRKGRCIDFIGFKFYRDKTLLRKKIMFKAIRKTKAVKRKLKLTWYDACQLLSYLGYFKHSNTYKIKEKYILTKISVKSCKQVISKHSKSLNLKKIEKCNKIVAKGETNDSNTIQNSGKSCKAA